jgi:hypothetical protein
MPVQYYIIPMVSPPFSRQNPQRPDYVDEIRCNWTGHHVDTLNVYVCKVNTTPAKHTDLASRAGVRQLPAGITWDTVINTLPANQQNALSSWLASRDIPFDPTETVGELLQRIINTGLFNFGNTPVNTQFVSLTQTQRDTVIAMCNKWGKPVPNNTDTLKQISKHVGSFVWNAPAYAVGEF